MTGCVDVIVFLTRCDKDASKVDKEDKWYLNMLEENLAEAILQGFQGVFHNLCV